MNTEEGTLPLESPTTTQEQPTATLPTAKMEEPIRTNEYVLGVEHDVLVKFLKLFRDGQFYGSCVDPQKPATQPIIGGIVHDI